MLAAAEPAVAGRGLGIGIPVCAIAKTLGRRGGRGTRPLIGSEAGTESAEASVSAGAAASCPGGATVEAPALAAAVVGLGQVKA